MTSPQKDLQENPHIAPLKNPQNRIANLMNQKENLKSIPEEQFSKYDVADHLTSRVEIAAYLRNAYKMDCRMLHGGKGEDKIEYKTDDR